MINWHKKYIKWWKKKLNVSDYGILGYLLLRD